MRITRAAKLAVLMSAFAIPAGWAATETVAYNFSRQPIYGPLPAAGCYPVGGLLGTNGGKVLYGVTSACGLLANGANAAGVLYRINRAQSGPGATYTILHSFDLDLEGGSPGGVPVTDGSSLFGILGSGAIYQWTPSKDGTNGGTLAILHRFSGSNDGRFPNGTLYRAADGTLYGTTYSGPAGYRGLVFSLAPPAPGHTGWTYSILHEFSGPDGSNPGDSLVQDTSGTLYGTTTYGGPAGHGTVFTLAPPAPGTQGWTLATIAGLADAGAPNMVNTPLLLGQAGALYATSQSGGAYDHGTVFKLVPPASAGAPWTTTILFSFNQSDGAKPFGAVIADSHGTLFGTTQIGGLYGLGTAFSLAPPATPGAAWQQTDLLDFEPGPTPPGAYPLGTLVFLANGALAGVTGAVNPNSSGVIYTLSP